VTNDTWMELNEGTPVRSLLTLYGDFFMKIRTLMLGAAIGLGALTALAAPASAYVTCNHDGDCWHTESRTRAPGVRFEYHPDHYYFHQRWDGERHWREHHDGRGYYRGGVWITL